MPSCPHLVQLSNIPAPRLSQPVHREECTQCFDSQDLPQGIDVCLLCFNGGCINDDEARRHAQLHQEKFGHPFSLNIRRKLKPTKARGEAEPPLKKLAIVEEREEDKYHHEAVLRCWLCDTSNGKLLPELLEEREVKRISTAIMQSMSSARQSEVKAWEEEIVACEHTLVLQQTATKPILESGLAHCFKCDLKDNLWLCLTCGGLGCGRQQFGGIGGNGHGLEHYMETQHPVSVKLGTITPEGNADIYCYVCNESRLDPVLAFHLSSFGINIAVQTKTEKSITELQIEHNLKFDFSLTGDDGKALEPLFGAGLTGLSNLGNSCYMASTLQTLFSLSAFRTRYLDSFPNHAPNCKEALPSACVDCQMCKLADGLFSGRYSVPRSHLSSPPSFFLTDTPMGASVPLQHVPVFQEGIKPAMFKALIGKGHEEFSTMRQQDAEEFFGYLLKVLRKQAKKIGAGAGEDVTDIFRFGMEQRLQCTVCGGVRYRIDEQDDLTIPVPSHKLGTTDDGKPTYATVALKQCLETVIATEELEYRCSRCVKNVRATKRLRFATFPHVLVIHAKKFQLIKWVPAKLDIPLQLPLDDTLTLDDYLGIGLQPGEVVLADDADSKDGNAPTLNESALEQLQAMGFPRNLCERALLTTGNNDAEIAMEWLFAHMDDADIDEPIASLQASAAEPATEQIEMLADMGFTPALARKALRETSADVERAIEWLFNHPDDVGEVGANESGATSSATHPGGSSTLPARYRLKAFISHKGPSVHSGHYVAHIRSDNGCWVLFNDEKVVKADAESVEELKKLAYLYVFQRV